MNAFDEEILLWMNGFAGTSALFDQVVRLVSSDYLVMLLFATVPLGLWLAGTNPAERERFQRAALIAAASVGISNLVVSLLINRIWDRPRPFEDLGDSVNLLFYRSTDPSFPSNPAAVAFAIAIAVRMVTPKLGWAMIICATIYTLSRVYVATSYPTDAIGGALLGLLAVWLSQFLFTLGKPLVEIAIRLVRGLGIA